MAQQTHMLARLLVVLLICSYASTAMARRHRKSGGGGGGGYSGDATAYASAGRRGSGACGIRKNLGKYETYFAAMNGRQYSGSKCGKCIRITGARGTIVAMVVDMCPGCGYGDVDLSSEGLKKTTGYSWDRKKVSWTWTSCR